MEIISMADDLTRLLGERIRDGEVRLAAAQKSVEEIELEIADYKNALFRENKRLNSTGGPIKDLNKTVTLLKFVRENQARGVTHKDMREHLESMGVKVSKNFTYNFVDRFKGTKLDEQGGRIFRKE
jgi:hypothetical protein